MSDQLTVAEEHGVFASRADAWAWLVSGGPRLHE